MRLRSDIIKTALLLGSFFNFRIIPGEVVPYFVLQRSFHRIPIFLFSVFSFVLLVKLLIIALMGSQQLGEYFVNGAEVLIVLLLLGIRRQDQSSEQRLMKIVVVTSIVATVAMFFLPFLEEFKFLLISRDVTFSQLQEFDRGFSFLAPEPSYAGVFFLGILIAARQCSLQIGWLVTIVLCILLTASIWAIFLLGLYVLSQLEASRRGILIALAALLALFSPFSFTYVLQLFGDRLVRVIDVVVELGWLDAVTVLEERFGSTRLGPTIDVFTTYEDFINLEYRPAYSLFAQSISVFGTFVGGIYISSVMFIIFDNCRSVGLRLAWIPVLVGPVALPTNYLGLRKMRKLPKLKSNAGDLVLKK